jgi:hypothetical protein
MATLRTSYIRAGAIAAAVAALAVPARASLGGNEASVQADAQQMDGGVRVTPGDRYTVYEIARRSGVVVREYLSPTGIVFAVAWEGPWMPDMRVVLGTYFDRYSQAHRPKRGHHRSFAVEEPDFVVHARGHMRAFYGEAYVLTLLPAGVDALEIR